MLHEVIGKIVSNFDVTHYAQQRANNRAQFQTPYTQMAYCLNREGAPALQLQWTCGKTSVLIVIPHFHTIT